jgi:hypothetical protein
MTRIPSHTIQDAPVAIRAGWSQSDVQLPRDGRAAGDDKVNSLAGAAPVASGQPE